MAEEPEPKIHSSRLHKSTTSTSDSWIRRHRDLTITVVISVILLSVASSVSNKNNSMQDAANTNPSGHHNSSASSPDNTNSSSSNANTQNNSGSSNIPTNTQPTKAQQIQAWCSKYCYINTTIGNDASQLGTDAGNENWSAMETDAQQFEADINTAMSFPAIPDPTTAADFSSSLTYYQAAAQDYANGAKDAMNGIADNDSELVTQAASEISEGTSAEQQGVTQMQNATAALESGQ